MVFTCFKFCHFPLFPWSIAGEEKEIEEEMIPPPSLECKLFKDRGFVYFIYCCIPAA